MGAERWRNATCQRSGATLDTGGEGCLGTSAARLLSAGGGGLWITRSNPRGSLAFQFYCQFWLFQPAAYGQAAPTASAEQIQALQKKLDALQNQMSEVQGELQRLSGSSGQPPSGR